MQAGCLSDIRIEKTTNNFLNGITRGSGCSTVVVHMPWEQKLVKAWVQFPTIIGLFSSPFQHRSVLNQVPQKVQDFLRVLMVVLLGAKEA